MGFKIKNSLTGEFEKLPILTLKGEKGETGGVEEYNKVDYMGNKYETLKQANDANVEYAVKTAIGEFNYLDYDGQHITATDSIEGRSKSAILKGNTLVNLLDSTSFKRNHGSWATTTTYDSTSRIFTLNLGANSGTSWNIDLLGMNSSLKKKLVDGKTYTVSINIIKNSNMNNFKIFGQSISSSSLGTINIVFTYNSSSHLSVFGYNDSNSTDSPRELKIIYNALVDGDYSDANIPYFEGMQSVKMPVLTTTGKNLICVGRGFDKPLITDGLTITRDVANQTITLNGTATRDNTSQTLDKLFYQEIKKDEKYALSCCLVSGTASSVSFRVNTENWSNSMSCELNKPQYKTFNKDVVYNNCSFRVDSGATFDNAVFKVMFERIDVNSNTTSYEPFKSNILTVNEEVELRKVGDVQDELNLITGELTQRIGEIVLDGNAGWSEYNGNYYVSAPGVQAAEKLPWGKATILSNLYPSFIGKETDVYIVSGWNGNQIKIRDVNLSLEELKSKLMTQPLVATYISNEELIKTVALSDHHVYSYKDVTHYDCSSAEGSLVPTLSVKVPTDVQATIAQQRETIQTLNSENERLNQIQEALKASMLDSQVQLMNISWNTDFEVFTLRESIAPKDFLLDSRTGSNIDKFSQAKFIIENDCPDLEKLNSQIEYYFSKDVFSQEQFEELTDLISIVKGENGCEY